MAWTAIKTWLPGDTLTQSDLNSYLFANLQEAEVEKYSNDRALLVSSGANQVTGRTITQSTVETTTFTTSSTTPVAITDPTVSITHSGSFLVFWTCYMSITAAELGQVGPQLSTGEGPAGLSRTVRTQSSLSVSYTGHMYYRVLTSPVTVQLYGWTNTGAGTLSVSRRWITVIRL